MRSFRSVVGDALFKTLERSGVYFPNLREYKKLIKSFYWRGLYEKIEPFEGVVVECGVAEGDSLATFCVLARREGKGRKVFGFDSWEEGGFSEPSPEDASPRNPKKGEYGNIKMARVRKMMNHVGGVTPTLVRGFVDATLPSFKESIALLHIDLDLYAPYKTTLTLLYPQVVRGGVIAFDEYNEAKWPGATKAVDEFIAKTGEVLHRDKYLNKYYIVKGGGRQ